ncbi:universal stress protein [Flavitalea sp. BT771]|uniref:universal stress protein n=1 Tax=Flavitalea sp. BT771 TaxID=3063329 RepID=UPI0026E3EC1E|nr:universal stress protein [Flavitalea sp. BT771]MDO6429495.1 universal stress protein [Flavitalea sp. BT771]MDV6218377.1 universal stress protein [Flavitalea sp. BT771]
MKQILVPTDFSSCAGNAINFAVQSAKLLPAEITLLHTTGLPGTLHTDYAGVDKAFRDQQLKDNASQLTALKQSIEQRHNVRVRTLITAVPLKEAIEEATASGNFDMVIMGTLGASGLKEKLWGSNTAAVIERSNVPVLAIPHEYTWKKPEKFLLATGNFEKAPALLNKVFELAGLYMAHVDVAVFTDEDDEAVSFLEHARNAPWYQQLLGQRYGEEALSTAQLSGKNLEKTLQDHIRDNGIDVLVMITYKRGCWERFFHPSHTKKMSYHTKVPLLAIPADKERKDA